MIRNLSFKEALHMLIRLTINKMKRTMEIQNIKKNGKKNLNVFLAQKGLQK
jgi:hypothetical protein